MHKTPYCHTHAELGNCFKKLFLVNIVPLQRPDRPTQNLQKDYFLFHAYMIIVQNK